MSYKYVTYINVVTTAGKSRSFRFLKTYSLEKSKNY